MNKIHWLTAALLALLPMGGATNQTPQSPIQSAASDGVVLSGRTDELRWSLHRPAVLRDLDNNDHLHISAPPGSRLLGAKYYEDEQTAVMAFRGARELKDVFEFIDEQIRRQEWQRTELGEATNADGDLEIAGRYERGRRDVELIVRETEPGRYYVFLDLSAAWGTEYGWPYWPQRGTLIPKPPYGPPLRVFPSDGVNFKFYDSGRLGELEPDEEEVLLSLPPETRAIDEPEYRGEDEMVLVPFVGEVPVGAVLRHYARQLKAQGFEFVPGTLERTEQGVRARYARGSIFLQVAARAEEDPAGQNEYMVTVDFTP